MTIIILNWYYTAGKDPRPIRVHAEAVAAWHRDTVNEATHVRFINGNPIYVKETPEEIDALIATAQMPQTAQAPPTPTELISGRKEKTHGRTKTRTPKA
jgi:hypothetical protein